jgi:pimeloyl-ACP methyl ester carboxylesterase
MPLAEVNGIKLHYEDSGGDGMALVFSHGILMDWEMFAPQGDALGERYRVITWDQRGHGETDPSPEPYSDWDSAEDLASLLDQLGIDKAVIAGVSQGGFIGLRFALLHPERTEALILIDTQAGVEDPDRAAQYDAFLEVWRTDGPNADIAEVVASIILGADYDGRGPWIAKWLTMPVENVVQAYRALKSREDIHQRLAEIDAPAMVIHGEDDIAIELEKAEALCSGLPNCRGMVTIPGAGHASNLIDPEAVNRAIQDFLEVRPAPHRRTRAVG